MGIEVDDLSVEDMQKLPVGTKVIHALEDDGSFFIYTIKQSKREKVLCDTNGWSFPLTHEGMRNAMFTPGAWILYDSPEGTMIRL